MSGRREVHTAERVGEPPALKPAKLRDVGRRDLVIRFGAGALTSIVAGLLTLWLGPRVSGVMLAFPAILGASLTLIEAEEDSAEAREDARGAILGGIALAAFAGVAALALPGLPGSLALVLATGVWAAVAFAGYFTLWR